VFVYYIFNEIRWWPPCSCDLLDLLSYYTFSKVRWWPPGPCDLLDLFLRGAVWKVMSPIFFSETVKTFIISFIVNAFFPRLRETLCACCVELFVQASELFTHAVFPCERGDSPIYSLTLKESICNCKGFLHSM
jgi:hypothetical protein